MALPSPSFTLARPTPADAETMANIYYDSFRTDPGNTYWWSRDRASQTTWLHQRVQKKLRDPSARHFKIVDVDGGDEMVAWARWAVPQGASAKAIRAMDAIIREERDVTRLVASGDGSAKADAAVVGEVGPTTAADAEPTTTAGGRAGAPEVIDHPEGADPASCQEFFDAIVRMSKKWDSSSMLGLAVLCTSPKYFRRGAGKALLVPMLEIADAEGLKTYLEATAAGKPLYEKLGFRQVDVLTFDVSKSVPDRDEPVEVSIMIREPKTTKS